MRSARVGLALVATLLVALALPTFAATEPIRRWATDVEAPMQMLMDDAGGIYTLQRVSDSATATTCIVLRKRAGNDGQLLWSQQRCGSIAGPFNDDPHRPSFAARMALEPNGDPVVAAYVGFTRVAVRFASASGAAVWESNADAPLQRSAEMGIAIGPGGDVWIRAAEGSASAITRLAGDTGATLWTQPVGIVESENEHFLAVNAQGISVMLKYTGGANVALQGRNGDGNVRWELAPGHFFQGEFVADTNGDFYVREMTPGSLGGQTSYAIVKRGIENGFAQRAYPQLNPGPYAVDRQNNLVMLQQEGENGGASFRYIIEKYTPDAHQIWRRQTTRMGNTSFLPNAFGFDLANDVIVAMFESDPSCCNNPLRYVLMKLAGATGRELWEAPARALPEAATNINFLSVTAFGIAIEYNLQGASTQRLALYQDGTLPPQGLATRRDFNADGYADMAFNAADGSSALWLMVGAQPQSTTTLLGPGTGWSVKRVANFDRNGTADLFWEHTDGSTAIWLMNGGVQVGGRRLFGGGTGWSMTHLADFNGDGTADILWKHADGTTAVWLVDGTTQMGGARLFGAGTGWSARLTGDFNGDGKADILWEHADGRAALWFMDGDRQAGGAGLLGPGTGWSAVATGDFNGDGRADIVWKHTDGSFAMWLMNGASMIGGARIRPFGASGWNVVGVGDLSGDGKDDLAWQAAGGNLEVWRMDGTRAVESLFLGVYPELAVKGIADFNGDGIADLVTQSTAGAVKAWMFSLGAVPSFYANEVVSPGEGLSVVAMPSGGQP